ncbi:abortive infection Abi-like protein [Shewanella putrefaciens]|nr:abortive infection Abi-like protein [Shewanella putrefaciens]
MASGAPGNAPVGSCERKCNDWLKRCNDDTNIEALKVLGLVLQNYMDNDSLTSRYSGTYTVEEGRAKINTALANNQLVYRNNGHVIKAGSTQISKTLEDYLKSGDFSSIENEFKRAVEHIQSDPHASITASCSIIEATLKYYIESFNELIMPSKLNVMDLWNVVKPHLTLNADATLAADQHKVLKGISSIIDGIGAFRSHIGSAHGRGSNPPSIEVAEARLVTNASHTIVVYILDVLHLKT